MNMKIHIAVAAFAFLPCLAAETVEPTYDGGARFAPSGIELKPVVFTEHWDVCNIKADWSKDAGGAEAFFVEYGQYGQEKVADGRMRLERAESEKVRLAWNFDILRDMNAEVFCISVDMPTDIFAGGSVSAGGKVFALPELQPEKPQFGGVNASGFVARTRDGREFSFSSGSDTWIAVQDNRKWRMKTFSVRIAIGDSALKRGAKRSIVVEASADGGFREMLKGPVVIEGEGWVPFPDTTDVAPGSALDFSDLGWIDAPAGKHGRLVAKGAHFEFEKLPGVPQRFYGCNLCFGANYLSAQDAEELCTRLVRLGYNALRIHHHESALCDPADGTTILPEKMAQLDTLMDACIRHGIYITTDLFVSRRVKWRACGIDLDGEIPMNRFKELVVLDSRVRSNYLAFARAFLDHVNPHTGRRWADEPALVLLALVNEGNLGNHGYGALKDYEAVKTRWAKPVPNDAWGNTPENAEFCVFLSDEAARFADDVRKFLRDEIGTKVLVTDMSCWKNPLAYQLARTHYDYVDDHFYVDHPEFLGDHWQLPSKCPNVNPLKGKDAGFMPIAMHRLLDRPFTVTEFNYSSPGQFRGVGGLFFGAQAALQDYDGLWRFTWSHSRDGLLEARPLSYFDVSRDPLARMTEKAVLALYMRRDMKPLDREFALVLPEKRLRADFAHGAHPRADLADVGWRFRFGTMVAENRPGTADKSASFPEDFADGELKLPQPGADSAAGDGQVRVDRDGGSFAVNTPKTQGVFAESGRFAVGRLEVDISGAPAAIWATALDSRDIEGSRRMLFVHVTDVQNTGAVYADRGKTILREWGTLPHLMRAGQARVVLSLSNGPRPRVYALGADGSRLAEVESAWADSKLSFVADVARDPHRATCYYEIAR